MNDSPIKPIVQEILRCENCGKLSKIVSLHNDFWNAKLKAAAQTFVCIWCKVAGCVALVNPNAENKPKIHGVPGILG